MTSGASAVTWTCCDCCPWRPEGCPDRHQFPCRACEQHLQAPTGTSRQDGAT